jgi:hypothetical protein
MTTFRTRDFILPAASALLLGAGYAVVRFAPPIAVIAAFRRGAVWAILAQVVIWVATVAWAWRQRPVGGWFGMSRRGWLTGVFLAFALSALVHWNGRHGWKILWDEVSIAGTAMDMHFAGEAGCVDKIQSIGPETVIVRTPVDKRPLLAPFLTSVLHAVTGYRAQNNVLLNGLLLPAFLVMLFVAGHRRGGVATGVAAALLGSGIPLLADNFCGGGLDALNLTCLMLVFLAAEIQMATPSAANNTLLFSSACMAAHVRYESGLFLGLVAAVMTLVAWRHRRIDFTWAMLASGLLLLLHPMQWRVFEIDPSRWQLESRLEATAVFSLRYVPDNLTHAIHFLFGPPVEMGNSLVLSLLGLVAGVCWVVRARRWFSMAELRSSPALAGWLAEAALIGHGFLMMAYFFGQFDDLLVSRLALPFLVGLVLIVARLIGSVGAAPWLPHGVAAVAAAGFVVSGLPGLALKSRGSDNHLARTCAWIQPYAEELIGRDALVIDPVARRAWIMNRVPAITADELAARPEALAFHGAAETFRTIYCVEKIILDHESARWTPMPTSDFTAILEGDEIDRLVLSPVEAIRLRKVTTIRTDTLEAWAAAHQRRMQEFDAEAFASRLSNSGFRRKWLDLLP